MGLECKRPGIENVLRPPALVVVAVVGPCFDEAYAPVGILAQPCGQDAAGRAASEHGDVVPRRSRRHAAGARGPRESSRAAPSAVPAPRAERGALARVPR